GPRCCPPYRRTGFHLAEVRGPLGRLRQPGRRRSPPLRRARPAAERAGARHWPERLDARALLRADVAGTFSESDEHVAAMAAL
ncbi:MAG: hypothetical protein AVDCRST_MAG08-4260, partial [uncultured Acetobacteraceae bacterium]